MTNRTSFGIYRARVLNDRCVVLERDWGCAEWQPVAVMAAEVADALGRELQQMAQESVRRAQVSYVSGEGAAIPAGQPHALS